jgi:SAM-dependent methyltransferase
VSHPEQLGFFQAVADANRTMLAGGSVLEVGSYDVNGTVRGIFSAAGQYVGVDLKDGPGVDVISYGHQLDSPDAAFDVTISGECFEHDPNWDLTFRNMVRMTRPGGLVAFTCASRGRPEHGTRRTRADDSPGTQAQGLDYYRNLDRTDFEKAIPFGDLFSEYRFWYLASHFDLYFAGVRAGAVSAHERRASLPDPHVITSLNGLMPLAHRTARLPLRLLSRALPDERYQSTIRPYWNSVERVGRSPRLSAWKRGSG